MKYHTVLGNNTEMGNIYPVVIGIREGYDTDGMRSYENLEFGKMPNFVPDLDGILVAPQANLTDFVSTRIPNPLYGILVSARLCEAILDYVSGVHGVFPAVVSYRGARHEYYWIHFCFDIKPFINFQNSRFSLTTLLGNKVDDILVNSLEEYLAVLKKYAAKYGIYANKLVICSEMVAMPHIFGVGVGGRYTVVSEELASLFKRGGFTGLLFGDAHWLEIE